MVHVIHECGSMPSILTGLNVVEMDTSINLCTKLSVWRYSGGIQAGEAELGILDTQVAYIKLTKSCYC